VGGIPELINDGVNGRLVPPGKPEALAEAVQDLLDHPEVAQTLGTQARTLVRFKHDPAQHAATLEKLYGSL
jgi:glycosyltransferase involved in cell wall biosynthesis